MNKKKILITAGRAFPCLDLARRFYAEGHKVYVCDPSYFHVCRFSKAVEKNFTVPSPRDNSEGFIESVLAIVKEFKIDLVVPILEEIFYLAKAKDRFPKSTILFCDNYDLLVKLHNKWWFNSMLKEHGFVVPFSEIIESEPLEKVSLFSYPYILKQSYSRGSLGVFPIFSEEDLEKVIFSKDNPMMVQEFIEGKKFCTYSVCRKGQVMAHVTYPVQHAISDSSCLTFKAIEHKEIKEWVEKLVRLINFEGQICFDFIQKEDGTLYAIECNPRATSGLHLLVDEEKFLDLFVKENPEPIESTYKHRKQIFLGMMVYGWRSKGLKDFFHTFFGSKDVLFSKKDLKPFIFQPLLFIVYILKSIRLRKNLSQMFLRDFDFDGEQN